jgi:apolipoprotein N-acyltransferase
MVREFLKYLDSIDTWLVTGNDDYTLETSQTGEEIRKDYNAAILFSNRGERVKTYHKIHLVPFTEYFPYQKHFPGFYQLLLDFDVYLWEPGSEWTVFQHPEFSFSTPICFEDCFPNHIRIFIDEGVEVIINLSNDFWSLTEVEAKQHYINSVFRAIENRKPLLRSTASGLTCYVDTTGKLQSSLPYYEEGYLIAEVSLLP